MYKHYFKEVLQPRFKKVIKNDPLLKRHLKKKEQQIVIYVNCLMSNTADTGISSKFCAGAPKSSSDTYSDTPPADT